MSGHTPGPWKQSVAAIRDSNSILVADVAERVTDEEQFSNAKLIAAAPGLAELLIAVLPILKDHGCDYGNGELETDTLNTLRKAGVIP